MNDAHQVKAVTDREGRGMNLRSIGSVVVSTSYRNRHRASGDFLLAVAGRATRTSKKCPRRLQKLLLSIARTCGANAVRCFRVDVLRLQLKYDATAGQSDRRIPRKHPLEAVQRLCRALHIMQTALYLDLEPLGRHEFFHEINHAPLSVGDGRIVLFQKLGKPFRNLIGDGRRALDNFGRLTDLIGKFPQRNEIHKATPCISEVTIASDSGSDQRDA